MSSALHEIKNFFQSAPAGLNTSTPGKSKDIRKNAALNISRIQFARIRNDIQSWREAVNEAELAYYPHRVRMQRLFQDTILNEHIDACIDKRKGLTLLRDFEFIDQNETPDEELKKLFQEVWFDNFQSYSLDALFYGYSLISLGDAVSDKFPELTVVPRQNISPDRTNVTSIVYQIDGVRFLEEPLASWHIWVPTPTDLGVSKCGYGLLYKIARTEIYLRNATESNVDGIEIFGQPIRKGKTTKTEEAERAQFENALANMGSSGWILLDDGQDELELTESKNVGAAYKIYDDFESRNQKKISKVLLGHADAMDSTPGKLGSDQGGEESPVQSAMNEKQVKDGKFMENIINNELLPKMRKIGFNIPIQKRFRYVNNAEKEEFRRKEDESNLATAQIAQTMKNAGLKMDAKYFEDRTGIPTEDAPDSVVPPIPGGGKPNGGAAPKDPKLNEKVKNKLKRIYSHPKRAV